MTSNNSLTQDAIAKWPDEVKTAIILDLNRALFEVSIALHTVEVFTGLLLEKEVESIIPLSNLVNSIRVEGGPLGESGLKALTSPAVTKYVEDQIGKAVDMATEMAAFIQGLMEQGVDTEELRELLG